MRGDGVNHFRLDLDNIDHHFTCNYHLRLILFSLLLLLRLLLLNDRHWNHDGFRDNDRLRDNDRPRDSNRIWDNDRLKLLLRSVWIDLLSFHRVFSRKVPSFFLFLDFFFSAFT